LAGAMMVYLVINFPFLSIVTLLRIAYNGYVRKEGITMKVTMYNFFRIGGEFHYVKDGRLTVLSAEMMVCMIHQYQMSGYIIEKNNLYITVTKVEKKG
jgi:hypothetical protein